MSFLEDGLALWRSLGRPKAQRGSRRRAVMRGHRCAIDALEIRLVLSGNPAIGVNLDTVADFTPAWTFTDVFLSSRDWFSHAYDVTTGAFSFSGGGPVHVDQHDWPTSLNQWTAANGDSMQQQLGTLMFRNLGNHYPAGIYTAEWQGTGTIEWGFAAQLVSQGTRADGTHFALVNVTPDDNGIFMKISTMSTADPIHDMHVWMPDYNGQSFVGQVWQPGDSFSPFHPAFVTELQPFGTLRFMQWENTNQSPLVNWSDRHTVGDARQSGPQGVAFEYMTELANELHDNVWLNIPYLANDDFVRNFASLTRDSLNTSSKIYLEWSNEVWNPSYGFATYYWITDQLALPQNAGLTREQFIAQQIKHDFGIWEDVFAGQENRLVRVVAGQAPNSASTGQILQNLNGHFDAVSAAAYIHLTATQRAGFSASTSSDDVLNAAFTNLPVDLFWLQQNKALADQYAALLGRPIQLLAYEGGQHLDAQSQNVSYLSALYAAQVNPRMYDLYQNLFEGFRDLGGDLFMHYSNISQDTTFGSWGSLQYQDSNPAGAPKYQALADVLSGAIFATAKVVKVADSQEAGEVPGGFLFVRSGDLKRQMVVTYQLSGSAGAADFHENLPGSVTFAPGQTSQLIAVTPINDGISEGTEQLTLSLTSSLSYAIDSQAGSASINISDSGGQLVAGQLAAQYFDNIDLKKVKASRVESGINFNWVGTTPDPSITNGSYSARWQGTIQAVSTGYYTFQTNTGDGARLWIDGTIVSDHWSAQYLTPWNSAAVYLTAGQLVSFRMDYYRQGGAGIAQLLWQTPGQSSFVLVPSHQFVANTTVPTVKIIDSFDAQEVGQTPGAFLVTRTGSTASQLTVSYLIGGTAATTDYQEFLSGAVTFAAGQASTSIAITPIDDNLAHPDKNITLTMTGSVAYNLDPSGTTATLTIKNGHTPPPPTASSGLTGQYFDNSDLTNLKFTRVDPNIDFFWGYSGGSPDPRIAADTYSIRWDGALLTKAAGNYSFQLYSDDGVRLWVNGALIVDQWGVKGVQRYFSAAVALPGFQTVPIRLEYMQDTGTSLVQLLWFAPSTPDYALIPASQFFTSTATASANPQVKITKTADAQEVGQVPGSFALTRTGPTTTPLTVGYQVNGTALASSYSETLTGAITFAVGESSKTIAITPIDDGLAHADTQLTLTLNGSSVYDVDATGSSATLLIKDAHTPPAAAPNGLTGSYFDNPDLTNLKFTRTDANIDFFWGWWAGSPDPRIAPDSYSVRWDGSLKTLAAGAYQFQTFSDDGVRLWVNGVLLIDQWSAIGAKWWVSQPITLGANQQVSIRLEYTENTGTSTVRLFWLPAGAPDYSLIPTAQLFTSTTVTAPAPATPPTIKITKTGDAQEVGQIAGGFLLTRTGDPSAALTVNYQVSGTAPSSAYQETLSGTVTFAAGQTSKAIAVTPIDDGLVHPDRQLTIVLTVSTQYAIDATGASASLLIQDAHVAAAPAGNGLTGQYFDNADLTNLKFSRIDPTVDFFWGWWAGSPDPRIAADTYSVRWDGYLQTKAAGAYRFQTFSDDGVRLWVNGVLLIDQWGVTGSNWWIGTPITLGANQQVTIRLEYMEDTGTSTVRLTWLPPGAADYATIPTAQLLPAGNTSNAPTTNSVDSVTPTVVSATPLVSIAARADALEKGQVPGSFVVTRSGDTSQALTVNYQQSGSANGADFQEDLTGVVTFAAGEVSKTITVTPIDDGIANADSTLALNLVGGSNYTVNSTAASASIAIHDAGSEAPAAGSGLTAQYFNNPDLTNLAVTRVDPSINFFWGWWNGSPDAAVAPNTFSARWQGYLTALTAGTYTFQTYSDDGVRVWIDGALAIDNWNLQGPAYSRSAGIILAAGQKVSIRVEYLQNTDAAVAKLEWQTPDQSKFTLIPQQQLTTT